MADEECQILKHSNQWVETIDPSIVTMKALVQGNAQGTTALLAQLSAHLTGLKKFPYNDGHLGTSSTGRHDGNAGQGRYYGNDNPPCIYEAPEDSTQKHTFHGRTWYFCTKCGRTGKWVCTHTDTTHRSSYQPSHGRRPISPSSHNRRNLPYSYEGNGYCSRARTLLSSRNSSPMHNRSRSVSFCPMPSPSPREKVSLLDSINAFTLSHDHKWAPLHIFVLYFALLVVCIG